MAKKVAFNDPNMCPMESAEGHRRASGQSPLSPRLPPAANPKSLRYSMESDYGVVEDLRQSVANQPKRRCWYYFKQFFQSQQFEMCMAVVILFNTALIIHESDLEAKCHPDYSNAIEECPSHNGQSIWWLPLANVLLLVIYTLEAAVRILLERKRYFYLGWNLMDLFLLVAGWGSETIRFVWGSEKNTSVSLLRFFRVARVLRTLRIFIAFHELYLLLQSLVAALKTLVWGTVMMFATLTISSIFMVEVIHPINSLTIYDDCPSCSMLYQSVMKSNLTLFQTVIIGDNWGQVSIKIIEREPWTAVVIITISILVTIGLMNLILAVIVERASEARERDFEVRLLMKNQEISQHRKELVGIFESIDSGGDGNLSLEELLNAYDHSSNLQQAMKMLDVDRDELPILFKFMDQDNSGGVSYIEFCDQICSVRGKDLRSLVLLMKCSLTELREDFRRLAPEACAQLHIPDSKASGDVGGNILPRTTPPMKVSLTVSDEEKGAKGASASELPSIYEVMQQQSQTLTMHFDLLQAVDSRFDKMAALLETKELPAAEETAKASAELPPKQRSAQSLLEDVSSLGRHAKELAMVKGNIVRRVEGQVGTLMQQAGTLAEISTSLRAGLDVSPRPPRHPGVPVATADLSATNLQRMNDKIDKLRNNMMQELASTLREVETHLESGASVLGRNTELLAGLHGELQLDGPRPPVAGGIPSAVGQAAGDLAKAAGDQLADKPAGMAKGFFSCDSVQSGKPVKLHAAAD